MNTSRTYSRRDALALMAAGTVAGTAARGGEASAQTADSPIAGAAERNDGAALAILKAQVTDPGSPWRGAVPDQVGLHWAGPAAGAVETLTASFVHARSRLHRDQEVLERIRLAAGFLERSQSPQGNIDLPTTNFNSPPDTGFVVHNVATAAAIAKGQGHEAITSALRPFLVKAGGGMVEGGVHTPNHRWVIGAALAQVHALFPDARFVRRIDEWLAEGIDIDRDGQFTERSTLVYNIVTDRAFIVMAAKLGRPELLEPVRRNLHALPYLIHADGELVTEISRRQDQFTRGGLNGYWFPLSYMAITDNDAQLGALARGIAPESARLSALIEYPELLHALPEAAALPENFEKRLADVGIARIRRGPLSATIVLTGSSRFFTLRHGEAVVEGVRFATAFFGKGQFVPDAADARTGGYGLRQSLTAPYYQPIARTVTPETWTAVRAERRPSEICTMQHAVEIAEAERGFRLRLRAAGTAGVPVAVEICLREGGRLDGCRPIAGAPETFLLERDTATYRVGRNQIRFGPGDAPHQYTQIRGAEPRLPGLTVYLTGFTPFDRTVVFEGA